MFTKKFTLCLGILLACSPLHSMQRAQTPKVQNQSNNASEQNYLQTLSQWIGNHPSTALAACTALGIAAVGITYYYYSKIKHIGSTNTTFTNSSNQLQGSGKIVKTTRFINDANIWGVSLANIGNLVITYGDTESLMIETDDNIEPFIQVASAQNTLELSLQPNISYAPTRLVYYLTVKNPLKELVCSGATSINADIPFNQKSVKISASGATNIAIKKLLTSTLMVQLSGTSVISIDKGIVTNQTIHCTGTSEYFAQSLKSTNGNITCEGVSKVSIDVHGKINATASGASSITYSGNPAGKTTDVTGVATIHKI